MKYDFTSILDRTGMDSIAVAPDEDPYGIAPVGKIKEGFDLIPMWVADMNFPTAPTICEAMIERAKHPAFGYFGPRKEYYDSIIRWQEVRNGVTGLEQKHIGYQNGVLGGVLSALAVLCSPGDNVLVHAPTYVGFLQEVGQMGYHLIGSELVRDENGVWRMDYDDMEKKIRQYLIDNNYVDCVIQLPGNLFFGTSIATCIMVLKKNKKDNRTLFIDASNEFVKVTNNNRLTAENIQKIVDTFASREKKKHFAHLAEYKEVENNDYNLSVSTYVEAEDTREKVDIVKLNAEIAEIVKREEVLRSQIDEIIREIEVGE